MSIYKPAIGIDIDGVIGDSDKVFRKYIKKYFGINLRRQDVKDFYYEKVLGIPENEMKNFWKRIDEEKRWLEIEILPGAKTALEYLKEKYQIIIITARPENIRNLTEEWLSKNQIYYDRLYFINEHKGESKLSAILSNSINLKCFIEDRIDFALDFIKAGIKVILFDYPWNRIEKNINSELLIRVKGWQEALSYL